MMIISSVKYGKVLLTLLVLGFFSCRTGEVLSEADPETEAETDKQEVLDKQS